MTTVFHPAVKTFEKSNSSEALMAREVHSSRPDRRDIKKTKEHLSSKRFSSERKKKKKKYPTLKNDKEKDKTKK
jgi:hypothetical protein